MYSLPLQEYYAYFEGHILGQSILMRHIGYDVPVGKLCPIFIFGFHILQDGNEHHRSLTKENYSICCVVYMDCLHLFYMYYQFTKLIM